MGPNPNTQAELNVALQWVAERQAGLHRELGGLTRVQSALRMALMSRREEPRPGSVSEESGDDALAAAESASPAPRRQTRTILTSRKWT